MADPDRISRLLARRGLLAIAGLVVLGMLVLTLRHERFVDLWLTPEQQATRARIVPRAHVRLPTKVERRARRVRNVVDGPRRRESTARGGVRKLRVQVLL